MYFEREHRRGDVPASERQSPGYVNWVMRLTRFVVVAFAVAGCGAGSEVAVPDVARSVPVTPGVTSPAGTAAVTEVPERVEERRRLPTLTIGPETNSASTWLVIDTTEPREATFVPEPSEWLVPSVAPLGVRLIAADRSVAGGCAATDSCPRTLPSATLVYDTDDLAQRRSLQIIQTAPSVTGGTGPGVVSNGQERMLGGRPVRAEDHTAEPLASILAEWTEPNANTVTVTAIGFTWSELDGLLSGLEPVNAQDWPDVPVQPRLARCIDATSQYAPTVVPDGWQRFVLEPTPPGPATSRPS